MAVNPEKIFNPNEHLMQLKSKQGSQDYLPVQWRLVWFRELCPEGTIETEMVLLDLDRETQEEVFVWNNEKRRSEKTLKTAPGIAVFRAIVRDGRGGIATGTKSEKAASFPDFIEKAETGSIGRALAALGYGTQFAPELDEQHRIVDAPVEREGQQDPPPAAQNAASQPRQAAPVKQPAPAANKVSEQPRQLIPAVKPPTSGQPVDVRKDLLNTIYVAGKAKRLWATQDGMAVYVTKCLKRPEGQSVLPSHLSKLTDDEIGKIKNAVEAAKEAKVSA